jgi:predicted transcriptional regulator
MAEETPTRVDPHLVAHIVRSYVGHHRVPVDQLAELISEVQRSLAGVERGAALPDATRIPAVPVRRSVHRDYVVCLECGFRSQVLRRHLRTAHGLETVAYRARWNLPPDHPLISPNYSARRSAMAKQLGLGRKRGPAEVSPPISEVAPPPAQKRRGRKPQSAVT